MGGHSVEYHPVVGQLDDESAEGEEIVDQPAPGGAVAELVQVEETVDQPAPGGAVAVAEVAEHEALMMVLMS